MGGYKYKILFLLQVMVSEMGAHMIELIALNPLET